MDTVEEALMRRSTKRGRTGVWSNQVSAPHWWKERNYRVVSWCFHAANISLNLFIPSSKIKELKRCVHAFKKKGRRRKMTVCVWSWNPSCFQPDCHTLACLPKWEHITGWQQLLMSKQVSKNVESCCGWYLHINLDLATVYLVYCMYFSLNN